MPRDDIRDCTMRSLGHLRRAIFAKGPAVSRRQRALVIGRLWLVLQCVPMALSLVVWAVHFKRWFVWMECERPWILLPYSSCRGDRSTGSLIASLVSTAHCRARASQVYLCHAGASTRPSRVALLPLPLSPPKFVTFTVTWGSSSVYHSIFSI